VLVTVIVLEAVGVFVGLLVWVRVLVRDGVAVSVDVSVNVRVAVADGVYVPVFSTGWKGVVVDVLEFSSGWNGVRLAGPGEMVTVYATVSPVMVGMNGRMDANSGGSTHPASNQHPATKVTNNRPFMRKP